MTALVRIDAYPSGVRALTLADPAHRNAIDGRMRDALSAAGSELAADAQARAVVIRAEGPAFCAGADVVETFGGATDRSVDEIRDDLVRIYDAFLWIRDLPIPTIAAVRGPAIGAGMNLALSCDVRFAAPDAAFGAVFSRIGLHPGGGCTYFLATTVGASRALRVLLDGTTVDAATAREYGLVDELVDDPESLALETAERWALLEPELARDIKRSVRLAVTDGFAASLDHEARAQARSARGARIAEVVSARRSKRAAADPR